MNRRAVWIFCVILFAVSQVTATVRTVNQARASQKRMTQFQQVFKMQQQIQEQHRQQLMQKLEQEPLSDEEKIKLFKEYVQKMQEQIRQQYEQQMQQQQQAQKQTF